MKFSTLATLLPLLLSSSLAYATTARDVFRARQAHVKKDLIVGVDVCVSLDMDVNVNAFGQKFGAGHIQLCLCIDAVVDFIQSHPVGKKVCDRLGEDNAHDYFANLIQNQNNSKRCQYPAHSSPMCSIGSPCSFTCQDGYTAFPSNNPTQCKCNAPHTECNGVCGSFPRGCGSKGFSRRKNDVPACSAGKTICGSPNGGKGFDCVNTIGDSESCGGCLIASPFGNNVADGRNCRSIPHVKDVDCNDGSCVVGSCKDGYEPSSTRDSCV